MGITSAPISLYNGTDNVNLVVLTQVCRPYTSPRNYEYLNHILCQCTCQAIGLDKWELLIVIDQFYSADYQCLYMIS